MLGRGHRKGGKRLSFFFFPPKRSVIFLASSLEPKLDSILAQLFGGLSGSTPVFFQTLMVIQSPASASPQKGPVKYSFLIEFRHTKISSPSPSLPS